MNKLAELRAHLAALKGKGLAIIDRADKEGRDLNADEEAAYDAIAGDIEETQADIDKAEKAAERRRTMASVTLSPQGANTVNDLNPITTHGFKDIAEFATAVRTGSRAGYASDSRLQTVATADGAHIGGAATGEGFMVPPEYRDEVIEVVTAMDEFGPLVDEEPTSKREVKTLADETTPWGAGGIEARWRNEGTKMDPSKLATQQRTVEVHELYAFVTATEELLEDAPRLANRITKSAGQRIAWKKNEAMVYGTGVNQPLGWMNSGALVTIPKEGGQTADTVVAKNVINMFSRLLRIPGDKPFWLANSDILPQLMTMLIGDEPAWLPPNGLIDAPGGMLLGLPIMLSEHGKTLGDKGDIQLISPKGYYALKRDTAPKYAESMHLYFDYAIHAFRWTFRFGGQPHLSKPVAPAHGNATKSHFVALAERA